MIHRHTIIVELEESEEALAEFVTDAVSSYIPWKSL
jgi:hypothetical protein